MHGTVVSLPQSWGKKIQEKQKHMLFKLVFMWYESETRNKEKQKNPAYFPVTLKLDTEQFYKPI